MIIQSLGSRRHKPCKLAEFLIIYFSRRTNYTTQGRDLLRMFTYSITAHPYVHDSWYQYSGEFEVNFRTVAYSLG